MKKYLSMFALTIAIALTTQPVSATIINGNDQTNATITIQAGDLTLSDISTYLTFNPLNIISSTATTESSSTIDVTITDYRGTHTGWTLNAFFEDFENTTTPGFALGANGYINSFTKEIGLTVVSGSATPAIDATVTNVFTPGDGMFQQFELARAIGSGGAGDTTLRIPMNMFEMVLTDKTKSGDYLGVMTFNLVNGPTS